MATPQPRPARPPRQLPAPASAAARAVRLLRHHAAVLLFLLAAGLLAAAALAGAIPPALAQAAGLLLTGAALGALLARVGTTSPQRQTPLAQEPARDALTGAHDFEQLQRDLERPLGSGARGLVAVLDIDGFRPLCAELGEPAGQRVLRGLSELLDQRLRRIDGLYRIGDDVFALHLPGLRLEDAAPRLYALHAELNAGLSRLPGRATLSIGAAHADLDEDGGSWLVRARAALAQARAQGPSRVFIDGGARAPLPEPTRVRRAHPQFLPPPR